MVFIKITLRKRDSVTSIVLYIYNIYYQTIKEREIELGTLLNYIKKFDKSESAARVSLSRMVKADVLKNIDRNDRVYYKLTKEGLNNIKAWNRGLDRFLKRYRLRHREWDNNWTTFNLIDFKKSREENQFIIDNLRELGYREIDNNVWFSPYYFVDEIIKLMDDKINYLISRGEIKTNVDWDIFLQKTYRINDLRKNYRQFLEDVEKMKQEIKEQNMKGGNLLPVLFKLGWSFYDIAIDDPALPLNLLENWIGDQAVEEMKEFREFLVEQVSLYFKTESEKDNE